MIVDVKLIASKKTILYISNSESLDSFRFCSIILLLLDLK